MSSNEILKFCSEKGFLLDSDLLELFSKNLDVETTKIVLEKIQTYTKKKILTKSFFINNQEEISKSFSNMPEENKQGIEKLKIKLGLSIEISRESFSEKENFNLKNNPLSGLNKHKIKILSDDIPKSKKLEVKDFITYFKNRFLNFRGILQEYSSLKNLISINNINKNRQNFSIIGLVSDKKITKNNNIILELEDLSGKINVLISKDKEDIFNKADDVALDSVIGVKCSGNREIVFANDIIFPDSFIPQRKKSPLEEYALFIGDLHIGSTRFMEENFLKFIDYVNGNVSNGSEINKIKYIVIAGDLIAGVGVYPNQENELVLLDLESQFEKAAELLGKIRKDISIIISPGNHDGVRLMEPQPTINKKYAWPLYELENIFFVGNPGEVNIGTIGNFEGLDILLYHGFSYFYYTNNIFSLIKQKAVGQPDLIMKYLLKNRHLAPAHASMQYFPFEKDYHFIEKIPDILVSGHLHKSVVSYYNNILLISVSTWESMTPYMEKTGAKPDFCKVPMLNLKTRAVKILDFE